MDDRIRQATRLWTSAQPIVSSFVISVVRDFRDRDDVLQEIAVAALESFDSFDPERPFVPWVMGIARNQVGRYLRNRRRDRHVFDDQTIDYLAAVFSEVSGKELQRLDALSSCLKLLQGRARQLCQLRYQQGLGLAGISEKTGMATPAIAKALQRVREQLRACVNRKLAEDMG